MTVLLWAVDYFAVMLVVAGILAWAVDHRGWSEGSPFLALIWPIAGCVWLGEWLAAKTKEAK